MSPTPPAAFTSTAAPRRSPARQMRAWLLLVLSCALLAPGLLRKAARPPDRATAALFPPSPRPYEPESPSFAGWVSAPPIHLETDGDEAPSPELGKYNRRGEEAFPSFLAPDAAKPVQYMLAPSFGFESGGLQLKGLTIGFRVDF